MPTRASDAVRAAILADIQAAADAQTPEEEPSQRAIAEKNGVSKKLVHDVAAENGLGHVWKRNQTKKATDARAADLRAQRAEAKQAALAAARHAVDNFRQAETGSDAKSWAIAFGIMSDQHFKYEKHEAPEEDKVDALVRIAAAMERNQRAEQERRSGGAATEG